MPPLWVYTPTGGGWLDGSEDVDLMLGTDKVDRMRGRQRGDCMVGGIAMTVYMVIPEPISFSEVLTMILFTPGMGEIPLRVAAEGETGPGILIARKFIFPKN